MQYFCEMDSGLELTYYQLEGKKNMFGLNLLKAHNQKLQNCTINIKYNLIKPNLIDDKMMNE